MVKNNKQTTEGTNMKSGTKLIIAGASLIALGTFILPAAIIVPILLSDSNQTTFIVPGKAQIQVETPGRHYLWNNYQTIYKGKSYNRPKTIPDGTEINITNAENGAPFEFIGNGSMTSSSGSNAKITIGYIEVTEPCTIDIEITGNSNECIFSFSKALFLKMFGLIFGGIALAFTCGMAGIGIIVWGIIKLEKNKNTPPPNDQTNI